MQYSPATNELARSAFGARYNPGPHRSGGVDYRYAAPESTVWEEGVEAVDLSWQWPLNDLWGDRGKDLGLGQGQGGGRWYGMGRPSYSLQDRKMTDGMLGIEYDGCCWTARVGLERTITGQEVPNTRIMLQIEFVGLGSIGSGSSRAMTRKIARYTPLRQPGVAPSRFTNYD